MKLSNIRLLTSMSYHPVGEKTNKLEDSVIRAMIRTHKGTEDREEASWTGGLKQASGRDV